MLNAKIAKRITIGAALFGIGVVAGAFMVGEQAIAQSSNADPGLQQAECVIRNAPKIQNIVPSTDSISGPFDWLLRMCIIHPTRLGR